MKDKKEMLLAYIKTNVAPVLVHFMLASDFSDAIVLSANTTLTELNGHYENIEFVPPKWYTNLLNISGNKYLIIDQIDTISKKEQKKFIEILKYRKISTFHLPSDCRIIITTNEVDKVDEEILSLVAMIWGVKYELWYWSFKEKNAC